MSRLLLLIAPLFVVGAVLVMLLVLGKGSRFPREEAYAVPHRQWIPELQVTCSGGDSFEVGHVVTTWSNWPDNVRRDAMPYFLVWHSAHGVERTYPLAVGGYTFAEVGWGAELRAWWSPEGRVKGIWVVARPAMPERKSFVLGALDTETGDYWSAYKWRNEPRIPWQARGLVDLCYAHPLPTTRLRADPPSWATLDGGQALTHVAPPESWDHAAGYDRDGSERSLAMSYELQMRMAGSDGKRY